MWMAKEPEYLGLHQDKKETPLVAIPTKENVHMLTMVLRFHASRAPDVGRLIQRGGVHTSPHGLPTMVPSLVNYPSRAARATSRDEIRVGCCSR